MVGQVRHVRLQRSRVEGFHRFSNSAVQRLAFTLQQFCINGLPRQRVTEGKLLRRFFDDELSRQQLLHQGEQLQLVVVCHLLQDGEIEATPGDRCENHELSGGRTQVVAALLHRVGNAAWDVQLAQWLAIPGPISVGDLPGREQRFEDLFDEKRIALGQGVDGIQKCRLHRTPEIEDGSQHCAGLVTGEAGERYLLPEVFTVELGQPM